MTDLDPAAIMAEHADHCDNEGVCIPNWAALEEWRKVRCLPYRLAAENAALRAEVEMLRLTLRNLLARLARRSSSDGAE